MVKECSNSACSKQASYGWKGEKPFFCKAHKNPEMVYVMKPLCSAEGCERRAYFGFTRDGQQWCAMHKHPKAINLYHRRCREPECQSRPSYAWPGHGALCCSAHKDAGMVDVVHKPVAGPKRAVGRPRKGPIGPAADPPANKEAAAAVGAPRRLPASFAPRMLSVKPQKVQERPPFLDAHELAQHERLIAAAARAAGHFPASHHPALPAMAPPRGASSDRETLPLSGGRWRRSSMDETTSEGSDTAPDDSPLGAPAAAPQVFLPFVMLRSAGPDGSGVGGGGGGGGGAGDDDLERAATALILLGHKAQAPVLQVVSCV